MSSKYLDDLNVEVGDVVFCVTSMNSPFTKAGHEYLVVQAGPNYAIESKDGSTILNPSGRFNKVHDIYDFPVHETQWRAA